MSRLSNSEVSLRVGDDDLDPAEISEILGASPTEAQTKGEKIVGKTGSVRFAKGGLWMLEAKDREPEDMDGQVQELLDQMTDDLAVWRGLTSKYCVDLFCGWFMREDGEGLTISPKSLEALGARGIKLAVCLYAPVEGENASETRA